MDLIIRSAILLTLIKFGFTSASGYSGCGSSFGCFASEGVCITNGGCAMITAYQYNATNKQFNFMIQGSGISSGSYIALGISTDDNMGSDMVFACTTDTTTPVTTSWNSGKSNIPATNVQIFNALGSLVNSVLTCNFSVANPIIVTVNSQTMTLDLVATNYYLLLATGPATGTTLNEHTKEIASTTSFNMTAITVKGSSEQNAGTKAHGVFMVLAWIACAPSGMLFARYYKKTWSTVEPCGKALWFRCHQILMGSTFIITIGGLVAMLIVEGVDPIGEGNIHALIGLLCIICVIIQPIMAFFRPHPGTSKRPIFNWAHFIVGNLGIYLGLVAIILGSLLFGLPFGIVIVLGIVILLHLIVHVVLSIVQRLNQQKSARVNDNGGPANPDPDEPKSMLRKVVAIIYVAAAFIFAIIYAIIIIAA